MKIITDHTPAYIHDLPLIPEQWEVIRRKVSHQAGRHAIIAGGAIRDRILGLPVKDIDIFVLGMSAQSAKEIFDADIVEYAGVEEAHHKYQERHGLTIDLVFSQYNNVREVLAHFDLGICRIGWDGDYILTDDFETDRSTSKVTTFYPSPSGHRDRVLAKLLPLGFGLGEDVFRSRHLANLRELAARQGYRLMHRRNDQFWLMQNQPMTLADVAEFLYQQH